MNTSFIFRNNLNNLAQAFKSESNIFRRPYTKQTGPRHNATPGSITTSRIFPHPAKGNF